MKLETHFEKLDQFADAPDAVAKMRELSANGASDTSLGQRPRSKAENRMRAVSPDPSCRVTIPSRTGQSMPLPMDRAFDAQGSSFRLFPGIGFK